MDESSLLRHPSQHGLEEEEKKNNNGLMMMMWFKGPNDPNLRYRIEELINYEVSIFEFPFPHPHPNPKIVKN